MAAVLFGLLGLVAPALAEDGEPVGAPLHIVTWSPSSGPLGLWRDAAGGLSALAGMVNANGGLGGRLLRIETIESSDPDALFQQLWESLGPADTLMAVGGPTGTTAPDIADIFRRARRTWLGPISNDARLYTGADSDPFALLPSYREELPAIFAYLGSALGRHGSTIAMVYYNREPATLAAELAERLAAGAGFTLLKAPINDGFGDWRFLSGYLSSKKTAAVILWLPAGDAAAFSRELRKDLPNVPRLANALAAPNEQLLLISDGAYAGLIFPSVLDENIPAAYANILSKYGPPGLRPSYQAYFGFGAGQVMSRALALELESGQAPLSAARGLYAADSYETLLGDFRAESSRRHFPRFYLAEVQPDASWKAVPNPVPIPGR